MHATFIARRHSASQKLFERDSKILSRPCADAPKCTEIRKTVAPANDWPDRGEGIFSRASSTNELALRWAFCNWAGLSARGREAVA